MDAEFKKTFAAAIKAQSEQNEVARKNLDAFLGNLRAQTHGVIDSGQLIPATAPPLPTVTAQPEAPVLASLPLDWVRLVIQAASLDPGFMEETQAKAAMIVAAVTSPEPATVPPADVSG